MLIKNTDGSHCKIKDIKISGLKAYITLVIYSAKPQTTPDNLGNVHRVFSFYLRDKNSDDLFRLSHNNYWIDRNHNYNNDSNNIDINLHKEIILEVDITNNNQADMQESRWVRQCNIILMDHTSILEEAWISEDITLISKEIELPKLSDLKIIHHSDNIITVDFNYTYESQEDFNYINTNLVTVIDIKSIHNNEILESLNFPHEFSYNTKKNSINFNSLHEYTEPVIVNISIKNLKGETLYSLSKFFNPNVSNYNITIKDINNIKVVSMSVKDTNIKTITSITNK